MRVARSMILPASARRASAVAGMPSSSIVRPITAAPRSLTSGSTRCSDFSSPLTELTSGLPGATGNAAARASWLGLSMQSGTLTTELTSLTTSGSSATSSMPGTPTLMSNTSAPQAT